MVSGFNPIYGRSKESNSPAGVNSRPGRNNHLPAQICHPSVTHVI